MRISGKMTFNNINRYMNYSKKVLFYRLRFEKFLIFKYKTDHIISLNQIKFQCVPSEVLN